ncbi:putative P4-family integrase [Rhodobacterales bacterium HTCC2150]|nr:putative P4-family integrase [Rhodobacterales bacterium HTCC2150] [Rhodobacteraceae bacterium HTCC2150]
MHAVGGVIGLVLQISPNSQSRHWIYRTTIGGKRRHIGLGSFPTVTLAMARQLAREAYLSIRNGQNPIEERKAATSALVAAEKRGLTFANAMEKYLAIKLAEFDNEKHRKQWGATLDKYAIPALGEMLVADIQVQDVRRALEPIWTNKTETASRLRGRIEAVLSWATVAGHREGDNPARWKGNLSEMLPKPSKLAKVKHQPALALDDAAAWFTDLRQREGTGARSLEFLALTASRSGEIRGATWDEIDFDAGLWVIPADRMKMSREHRVPLTGDATAMLKSLPRLVGSPYVFPAAKGGMISDMTISAVMRRQGFIDAHSGRTAVPHGLRSTFRDWAAERTDYPRDMAEIALAHNVGSEVERAYRRGDMVEKRRSMMTAWGKFLRGEQGQKVVGIRG